MISRTFKLCLNAGSGSAPYINVNQYDEGETWLFELYSENGERYIPSSGAIVGVKSDGHGIVNTGTVDSEGRVVITETQQMTASAGRAIYELSIDGLTHGTANFIVAVERKPTDDAVMSDSDLSLIQEAIDSAEVIVEVIGDGDPSEVIGEHVDAWLDNHPEATTTVEDGAITAPKINSTLWDKLLVSEEASGAVASFDDGADDVPVSSLKVALEPIQTGTGDPSPSNIRPIYPANGKNLIGALRSDAQTSYGVTITPNGDGTFTANGTNTKGTTSDYVISNGSLYLPVGNYALNGAVYGTNGTGSTLYITIKDANNQVRYVGNNSTADSTFSLAEGEYIASSFIRFATNGTANNLVFKPMIRPASITDASYQPYQGIAVQQTGKNVVSAVTYGNPTNIYAPVIYGATYTLVAGKRYIFSFKTSNTGEQIYRQSPESLGLVSASAYSWFCDGTVKYFYGTAAQSITITNKSVISKAATGSAVGEVSEFMVEAVEDDVTTPSAYEPYTSASYPYTLGQSVYGGSVDLATGVLTVDKAYMLLDGSEAWALQSINSYGIANFGLNTRLSNYKEGSVSAIITDKFKRQTTTASQTTESGVYVASTSYLYVRMDSATVSTVADFKTWLAINNMQCVYDMGTPTTVQLTPQEVKTLLGYNNISSSGTVDVIYHADTKLYVDKMTNVDNNIIAPTEETFTATRNYTVNDLVIVNDTLYKVTANIAGGSAITPNSNVQQTTLGALIKALS